MRLAEVGQNFNVSLHNSIPVSAWNRPSDEAAVVSLNSDQGLLVVRVNGDAFWGLLYTPSTQSASFEVPSGCFYCVFTIPSNIVPTELCVACLSSVFPDPVILINGIDSLSGPFVYESMSYYKFDIRPYFLQQN